MILSSAQGWRFQGKCGGYKEIGYTSRTLLYLHGLDRNGEALKRLPPCPRFRAGATIYRKVRKV